MLALPWVVRAFPTLVLCVVSNRPIDIILENAVRRGHDDKLLDRVRKLEVLVKDVRDDEIVF